jgi:hypothetical protein
MPAVDYNFLKTMVEPSRRMQVIIGNYTTGKIPIRIVTDDPTMDFPKDMLDILDTLGVALANSVKNAENFIPGFILYAIKDKGIFLKTTIVGMEINPPSILVLSSDYKLDGFYKNKKSIKEMLKPKPNDVGKLKTYLQSYVPRTNKAVEVFNNFLKQIPEAMKDDKGFYSVIVETPFTMNDEEITKLAGNVQTGNVVGDPSFF